MAGVVGVVLVRHAESAWNAVGRWQGLADPPLSPAGRHQARAAGHLVSEHPPSRVVTSPLRRAAETAELLRAGLPGVAPEAEPNLVEYDAGAWTGLTRVEIERRWPGLLARWDAGELDESPGGEPAAPFARRVVHAVTDIAAGEGKGGASWVLAVTHGRALDVLARSLGAAPAPVVHLGGWVVRAHTDHHGGRPALELLRAVRLGGAPLPAGGEIGA